MTNDEREKLIEAMAPLTRELASNLGLVQAVCRRTGETLTAQCDRCYGVQCVEASDDAVDAITATLAAAIAVAEPAIQADEREQCAKIADASAVYHTDMADRMKDFYPRNAALGMRGVSINIARTIRSQPESRT